MTTSLYSVIQQCQVHKIVFLVDVFYCKLKEKAHIKEKSIVKKKRYVKSVLFFFWRLGLIVLVQQIVMFVFLVSLKTERHLANS